jgi:iron complex outermembrane receptor protein
MHVKTTRRLALVCVLLAAASEPSRAQQAPAPSSDNASALGEIVVTARKRAESIMSAPVVVEAITSAQVENLKIADMSDLASVTPGLVVGDAFVGVGATVYMRGLGNGNSAQLIDQSVLLNIDGVSMSHGAFYKLGMFDVGQIEVLKGPQALFFGKSSSAGIIAVHSADPTADWESKATVGYEYYGNEKDVDAYVSGPLTDNLGIRVAGYHNVQGGWLYNVNPYTANGRVPGGEYDGARLTLKYDNPQSGLRMNLKLSTMYNYVNVGATGLDQAVCTGSSRQKGGPYGYIDNCRIDDILDGVADPFPYNPHVNWPGSYGNAAAFASGSPSPLFRNGKPYTGLRRCARPHVFIGDRLCMDTAVLGGQCSPRARWQQHRHIRARRQYCRK